MWFGSLIVQAVYRNYKKNGGDSNMTKNIFFGTIVSESGLYTLTRQTFSNFTVYTF